MKVSVLYVLARTDARSLLLLVVTALWLCRTCSARDCVCNQLTCDIPRNCSAGITTDPCGCCEVCARGLGDPCGETGDSPGVCGYGLECVIPPWTRDGARGDRSGTCEEIKPGCENVACDSVITHRCPKDSVLVYNGTSDDKCCRTTYECECDTSVCKIPRCVAGHSPQLLRQSSGKPGFCCDLYQCKVSGCKSTAGDVYKNSEVWKEGDCVVCHCLEGKNHCQAEMCVKTCLNPRYVPGRCCPICDTPRLYPNQSTAKCADLSTCNITCLTGLQQTPDGCHVCRCKPEGCYKDCRYGYVMDVWGRETCDCHKPPSSCPPQTQCTKKCAHGFKISKKGCPKCRCNKCSNSNDCQKTCSHGYQRDKQGCQVCKCQEPVWERNCSHGGVDYMPGQAWSVEPCQQCWCRRDAQVVCEDVTCPLLSCSLMVKKDGHCCPICLNFSISPVGVTEQDVSRAAQQDESEKLAAMEQKYIISLSIAGAFIMVLLVLVFVLLYLKLKARHRASWSVAGLDSYCKCPLFVGNSPELQHKYNVNADSQSKLTYDTVVVQKYHHPCVEVSLKSVDSQMDEKNKFILPESEKVSETNTTKLKNDYSYVDWPPT